VKAEKAVGFSDPAFTENRDEPLHRWVPWVAGFSSAFVRDALRAYAGGPQRRRVLDPFAGVGTTLVEAALAGHEAIGFELNPYAALAARTKANAARVDLPAFQQAIASLQRASRRWGSRRPPAHLRPEGFRSRIPFFSESVLNQVLHALAYLERLPEPATADLFRLALGSVMVSFSNYTYEPSLGSRPAAGKELIEEADVAATLLAKLGEMSDDIAWAKAQAAAAASPGSATVHTGDFLTSDGVLPTASVDLVITSPPYLNNYHYVRNTRPQLFWLSFVATSEELKALEQANFGKYWQTVRIGPPVALECPHEGIRALLEELRETRVAEGAYGGPGWANYVASYFNDSWRFAQVLRQALRPGARAIVVIGNSIVQGINIPTDVLLGELAERAGLEVAERQVVREKRVGASITASSVRRGASRAALYEAALVIRSSLH